VEKAYTGWPDRLYLIDKEGRVAFKSAPGPFGFKHNYSNRICLTYCGVDPDNHGSDVHRACSRVGKQPISSGRSMRKVSTASRGIRTDGRAAARDRAYDSADQAVIAVRFDASLFVRSVSLAHLR